MGDWRCCERTKWESQELSQVMFGEALDVMGPCLVSCHKLSGAHLTSSTGWHMCKNGVNASDLVSRTAMLQGFCRVAGGSEAPSSDGFHAHVEHEEGTVCDVFTTERGSVCVNSLSWARTFKTQLFPLPSWVARGKLRGRVQRVAIACG